MNQKAAQHGRWLATIGAQARSPSEIFAATFLPEGIDEFLGRHEIDANHLKVSKPLGRCLGHRIRHHDCTQVRGVPRVHRLVKSTLMASSREPLTTYHTRNWRSEP